MSIEHSLITLANNHGIVAMEFDDAADREAFTLTSAHKYKGACQLDDGSLWAVSPKPGGGYGWTKIADGPTPAVVSPLVTMVGHVKQMFEAATGLSASGWTDQSPSAANLGGGVNWTTGSDAGGAYAQVVGASTQYKTSALTLVAPATTPIMLDVIVQQDTFTASAPLFSLETGGKCFVLQTTSGNVKMRNGSDVGPTAFALGAFKRVRCIFTGATSGTADSIQIGAGTPATGFAGNDLPNGLTLGAANGSFFTGKYRAAYLYNAIATTPQKTALDAYYASLYGAGVVS